MQQIVDWLQNIGLGQYAPRFAENDITFAILAVQQRLTDLGQESRPRDKQTPQALAARQKAEIEKWWPVIKAANIRAE
jgi:hypothetical protein